MYCLQGTACELLCPMHFVSQQATHSVVQSSPLSPAVRNHPVCGDLLMALTAQPVCWINTAVYQMLDGASKIALVRSLRRTHTSLATICCQLNMNQHVYYSLFCSSHALTRERFSVFRRCHRASRARASSVLWHWPRKNITIYKT